MKPLAFLHVGMTKIIVKTNVKKSFVHALHIYESMDHLIICGWFIYGIYGYNLTSYGESKEIHPDTKYDLTIILSHRQASTVIFKARHCQCVLCLKGCIQQNVYILYIDYIYIIHVNKQINIDNK
jgi:hypothetical protein